MTDDELEAMRKEAVESSPLSLRVHLMPEEAIWLVDEIRELREAVRKLRNFAGIVASGSWSVKENEARLVLDMTKKYE